MDNLRFFYLPFVAALLLSCSDRKEDKIVTTGSLIEEMVDMERLTILPSVNYRTVQYSSYDRRSKSPSDSCWFSNEDGFGNEPVPGFSKVIREPDSTGTGEYLICDIKEPGAITRLWTAGINGKISLYLDDNELPFYEGDAQDFFWNTYEALSGNKDSSGLFRQYDAYYFPVTFSRRCRILWTGDISKIHFYHVGLKIYNRDARVETLSSFSLDTLERKIREISDILLQPDRLSETVSDRLIRKDIILGDSSSKTVFYREGTEAIDLFTLKLTSHNPEEALRGNILSIYFDGSSIPQIHAPAGDFFGSAPGLNTYQSLPFSVLHDGTMICRFIMPYRRSVRVDMENRTGEKVKVSCGMSIRKWNWQDGKTMHLRARWKSDNGITASGFNSPDGNIQDIIFLMASGSGRVVGTAAFIYNPSNVPTSWGNWWGEGDEKIYVDRDTFPSFFGTGTEDYFNYSWSSQRIFSFPYCGQPRNDGPGNRGYVSDFRWHITDDILFRDKIAFFMELGHHGTVPDFSYNRIVYYYALPGTVDDFRRIQVSELNYIPYANWEPVAYLGSEGYSFIQAEELISPSSSVKPEEGRQYAGGKGITWKPLKKGEKLKFFISSPAEVSNASIAFTFLHDPDGATISATLNGDQIRFDGNYAISLFEPEQTTLVNHFSENIQLKKGRNEIVFESLDNERGKKAGIDFIWIKSEK